MWVAVRNLVVVVVVYYLVPVGANPASWATWLRAALFIAGMVFVVWAVHDATRRQARADEEALPVNRLVLLTVLGIALFALADFTVATIREGEFVGLRTRTDALYFAVVTLATVGYGDIHAQGQLARALVTIQIAFNLVVLATAFSLLSRRLTARSQERG